ncbi:unnamed protein product [Pedinophyceae sp. YPF-701]|nr:unnamed protein product [Pedinophyceae sp. YPF-701]
MAGARGGKVRQAAPGAAEVDKQGKKQTNLDCFVFRTSDATQPNVSMNGHHTPDTNGEPSPANGSTAKAAERASNAKVEVQAEVLDQACSGAAGASAGAPQEPSAAPKQRFPRAAAPKNLRYDSDDDERPRKSAPRREGENIMPEGAAWGKRPDGGIPLPVPGDGRCSRTGGKGPSYRCKRPTYLDTRFCHHHYFNYYLKSNKNNVHKKTIKNDDKGKAPEPRAHVPETPSTSAEQDPPASPRAEPTPAVKRSPSPEPAAAETAVPRPAKKARKAAPPKPKPRPAACSDEAHIRNMETAADDIAAIVAPLDPATLAGLAAPRAPAAAPRAPAKRDPIAAPLLAALDAFGASVRGSSAALYPREVDVARVAPEALIGRQLRILWDGDKDEEGNFMDSWYIGEVVAFDPLSMCHVVRYRDGTAAPRPALLVADRCRVLLAPGEELPEPDAETVRMYGLALAALVHVVACRGKPELADAVARMVLRSPDDLVEHVRSMAAAAAAQDGAFGANTARAAATALLHYRREGALQENGCLTMQGCPAGAAVPPEASVDANGDGTQQIALDYDDCMGAAVMSDMRQKSNVLLHIAARMAEGQAVSLSESVRAGDVLSHLTPALHVPQGEVCWVRAVNSGADECWWPAMATTWEDALGDLDDEGPDPNGAECVAVRRFGKHDVVLAARALPGGDGAGYEIADFAAGIEAGAHRPQLPEGGGLSAVFAAAMQEALAYLREGKLPEEMVPASGDEWWLQRDEQERQRMMAEMGGDENAPLPEIPEQGLEIDPTLRLLAPGRIEYLMPMYHTRKHIFPVGYAAERLAKLPSAGGQEVWCRCTIEDGDGTAPTFRVAPRGGKKTYEGPSPHAAWEACLSDGGSKDKRKGGVRVPEGKGASLFGLEEYMVRRFFKALPGAEHLHGHHGWPSGVGPKMAEKGCPEVARARALKSVAKARLPDGVKPRVLTHVREGRCNACGLEEDHDYNMLLQCDRCRCHVHMHCYGLVDSPLTSRPWLCNSCAVVASSTPEAREAAGVSDLADPPACALCPGVGGVMRATSCGRWVHVACAAWFTACTLPSGFAGPVTVLWDSRLLQDQQNLRCSLCRSPHGACVQCSGHAKCTTSFHATCAMEAGLTLVREEVVGGEGKDAIIWGAGEHASAADAKPWVAPPTLLPSDGAEAQDARRARPRQPAGTPFQGAQLMGYCRKHDCPGKPDKLRASGVPCGPGALLRRRFIGRASANIRHLGSTSGPVIGTGTRADPPAPDPECPLVAKYPPCTYDAPDVDGGCARAVPFDHRLKRGFREPAALAHALRKRQYVRPTPYLEGGARLPGHDGWLAMLNATSTCTTVEGSGATAKRSTECCLGGVPLSGSDADALATLSQEDAFRRLQPSIGKRLTAGKSLIHGTGAFAKAPIRAGEPVCEYAGELVRDVMAEVRERKLYDRIVGAGTYVFKLDESACVDATLSGNIGHLLNHSCDVNCYSRPITIAGKNHVVLFALRDIRIGEELTYDYRFGGLEKLPCSCGAPCCRGVVNRPDDDGWPPAETEEAQGGQVKYLGTCVQ